MAENGAQALVQVVGRMATSILRTIHLLMAVGYTESIEHFAYQLRLTTGATDAIGTSYSGAIRISQESSFCLEAVVCNARRVSDGVLIGMSSTNNGAAGDLPDFPYLMQITDGGADRILHNAQIDGAALYSTVGALRWPLKRRLFRPNSNIAIDLTSLKLPNTAWALSVVFVGFKIYGAQPQDVSLPLPSPAGR